MNARTGHRTDHITNSSIEPPPFERHIDEAYQRLRSCITAAMHTARGRPTFPQDLARHLQINKNLAWHISKVIESRSPVEGVPHLPGSSGMRLLLKAARDAGADEEVIRQVEEAHAVFQNAVEVHAGSPETLELLLDGRPDGHHGDTLVVSRKIAFRGNSGVCGIQARAKLTAFFIAPGRQDPSKLDTLLLAGFVDVCRLRPIEGWPLFRIREYSGSGENPAEKGTIPVLPESLDVIDDFAEGAPANLTFDRDARGLTFRLGEGRVGRTGQSSMFFVRPAHGVFDRYATEGDDTGTLTSVIEVPAQAQVFDVFVHRDLGYSRSIRLSVLGRPGGGLDDHESPATRQALPIVVRPETLPGEPAACATPVFARYPQLLERANRQTNWDLSAFSCTRFVVEYPPLHSTVSVTFPLDERP